MTFLYKIKWLYCEMAVNNELHAFIALCTFNLSLDMCKSYIEMLAIMLLCSKYAVEMILSEMLLI